MVQSQRTAKKRLKTAYSIVKWRPAAIVSEGWTVSEATSQI